MRRVARLGAAASTLAFVAVLFATKAGRIEARPWLLAALAAAVFLCSVVAFAGAGREAWAVPEGRWKRLAEALFFAGLLVISGAGLARGLLDVRGVVVLTEGEAVDLDAGRGLEALEAGPLARKQLLSGRVRLVRVKLRPDPRLGVAATSLLERVRTDGQREPLEIGTGRGASAGAIVFQQGAFGFAPRLILQKDGRTVIDRTLHFTSRVSPADGGVVFEGELDVPGGGLRVTAGIDLSSLDEAMRGHPLLVAEVRQGDEVLGGGRLLPGHGATMKDGWHLGFAGVKMWSEVDVSRRSARAPGLAGAALALTGAALWLAALVAGRLRGGRP